MDTDGAQETLSQSDDMEILEELLPAKNQTVFLARKLIIPDHTVETIHKEQTDQKERLYRVIQEFLKHVEPRPTWRVILDALRSPTVNLPRLAKEIERRHVFHTPPSEPTSHPSSASTGLSSSAATAVVPYSSPAAAANPQSLVPVQASGYKFTLAELEAKIDELEETFDELRTKTCNELQDKKVVVRKVVYELTTLKARDRSEHKVFLKENLEILKKREDLIELFEDLNFYWNYLSPGLLEHLAKKFHLESVKMELQLYKVALQEFRVQTPLTLFCQIEVKCVKPTEEFCNIIVKFRASNATTLQDVENFRRKYADHYNLYDFILRLNSITDGSFNASFLVPEPVIEILRVNIPEEMLKVFGVTRLEIAGSCVYSECDTTADVSVGGLHSRPRSPLIPHFAPTSARGGVTQQKLQERQLMVKTITGQKVKMKELEEQLQSSEREKQTVRQQLTQKEAELTRAEETIRREQQQIQEMRQRETELVQAVDCELAQAQQQLRKKGEQLRSSEREKHIVKQQLNKAKDIILQMQQQMLQMLSEKEEILSLKSKVAKQLTMKDDKTAPQRLIRGSATTDRRFAYLTPYDSQSVYSYEWNTERWKELPQSPYYDSALVFFNGDLTTVGGESESKYTNKLMTLRQRRWVEEYPPMKNARSSPAVVSTSDGDYVIVIGGFNHHWTATVELFQVKTRQWYKLTNLPQPLTFPSATICGNKVHVIGASYNGYSCSLQALPSSDETIILQSIPGLISWAPLPPLPVKRSTASTLFEQLVIIGGWRGGSPVNSIHQLVEGQWVEIGSMTNGRCECLAVSPSDLPDRVMIVGGIGAENNVEEFIL